ncbi:KAP family P-loop NTPase fold protein [Streptomyces doebereineriae]|uniref:P-loop NTPase fold protein n=1 Tax=Streptomyces doebereineriae TaxID=3075528 RepID=A0ABU2V7H7_9ACTN|nr:P-loop NTPase fold protein [Streptomyces sp. DSM 41640]MDT0481500.1 P-loop NTPase fold protein [Streptomyces sp. DSM 41640]
MNISWNGLAANYQQFHTLVALLLLRLNPRAEVPENLLSSHPSRGDVFEVTETGEYIAFEIKSFAGPMTASRRTQIRETLRSVEENPPDRWNLVCAADLGPGDYQWFDKLRGRYPFIGEFHGANWLDQQITKHPDLQRYVALDLSADLMSRFDRELTERALILAGVPNANVPERGAVHFRGFSDRPASRDSLDRIALINAVADLLAPIDVSDEVIRSVGEDETGPSVVAIEGPWGSGKSTMMQLIEEEVLARQHDASILPVERHWLKRKTAKKKRAPWSHRRFLPVRTAIWALRTHRQLSPMGKGNAKSTHHKNNQIRPAARKAVTVRFNPWSYQTSDQIWAGLSREIVEASRTAQGVDGRARETYWLQRNAARLDRHQLRRTAARRLLSPLLRVAVFALVVPVVAQLAKADAKYNWEGHTVNAALFAIALPLVLLSLGLLHTVSRFLWGRARSFLPGEVLDGPVLSGAFATNADGGADSALRDPYYNARSGYLYLVQHDIRDLLDTIYSSGQEIIIFIDDLDRCSARATAEVFEAINLFLSGALHSQQRGAEPSAPPCRFVLGLDSSVVASHLDRAYADFGSVRGQAGHQDPSWGWTFLRKLIQLPIALPPIKHQSLTIAVNNLLGPVDDKEGADRSTPPPASTAPSSISTGRIPKTFNIPEESALTPEVEKQVLILEKHRAVRDRLQERLSAQRHVSIREAKRLLTVWQFYLRVLAYKESATKTLSADDAMHLITLAEIIARWPALQAALCSRVDGQAGLALLAPNTADDVDWAKALRGLGIEEGIHGDACDDLRRLLATSEGPPLAKLAQRLF